MMLYYRTIGSGEPVVLLHGYLSSGHYWHHLVPLLTQQGRRVITIDLLGFGGSPKPRDNDYSLDSHADAVLRTIHAILGTQARFTLVGHSMGALVASQLVHKLPDQVDKLVLFNMPVFTAKAQARTTFAQTSFVYKSMLYTPAGRVGWPILKKLVSSPLIRTMPRTLRPIAHSSSQNTHTSRRRSLEHAIERTNGIELLAGIRVPTQFVGGIYDRRIYKENIEAHAHELPHNITITWLEAGHHIPAKLPDVATGFI